MRATALSPTAFIVPVLQQEGLAHAVTPRAATFTSAKQGAVTLLRVKAASPKMGSKAQLIYREAAAWAHLIQGLCAQKGGGNSATETATEAAIS